MTREKNGMKSRTMSMAARAMGWVAAGAIVTTGAWAQALAPAVAVEAEEFKIEKGWKVIRVGEGNYTVDIIGFCHMGGERLLQADAADTTASAVMNVNVPEAGDYVLWARYEYPAFTEAIFKVVVEQGGKKVAEKVMGKKDNDRLCFNDARLRPQYDPPWGPEGTAEEPLDVKGLKAGPAQIRLLAQAQSGGPGISANRNIDLIYLTRNTEPVMKDGKPNPASWWAQGGGAGALYPILNAFRDSRGARWEVAVVNKGSKPIAMTAEHAYNRVPWGQNEALFKDLAPGATSAWIPLAKQDTAHFSMTKFAAAEPFELQLRPVGGSPVGKWTPDGGAVRLYIPPYPIWGEKPKTPMEAIDAVLAHLKKTPAPGKNPTVPLAYGGWIFIDQSGVYGQKYGELYKAIGMRALPSTLQDKSVMDKMGLPLTRSAQAMLYRQYPTPGNIAKVKETFEKNGLMAQLKFFDYGDEIHFSEWMEPATQGKKDQIPQMWKDWYAKRFPGKALPAEKPDSSAAASRANPRLFVDSTMFYENLVMEWVAAGNRAAKAALGPDVLCGANYAAHPFYYPSVPMYVHWFRRGAADWGRHSEYFWQVCQPGPMINGYIAEHFRAGMRFNPKAINRQYTMPHSPGNTEASFMRTAFSHLAHGAKALDYFGIGMNECFTENHIDHRDQDRFRQIRDVNHAMGLVEDVWPQSEGVQSEVAILLSESTERWDMAGVAGDKASHSMFGEDFRKIRLSYHLDRVGLWKALTFAGASPDLLIEEDLKADRLKGYRLLVVVGDSIPVEAAAAIEQFAKAGGTVVATAGVGRYGAYREANPAMQELFGIASRTLEERETFIRPLQEMQLLKPQGMIVGEGWELPALAIHERIKPAADTEVLATHKDGGGPAIIGRKLGKGRTIYVSALPGVAYVWSALQPPRVADRGVNTHQVPVNFDAGATALVTRWLADAGVEPLVRMGGSLIDTRLVKSGKTYVLPVANFNATVGQDVTFSLKLEGSVKTVTSAYRGVLTAATESGRVVFTVPQLGYGDLIRIDLK
jgi:hypothetical protein